MLSNSFLVAAAFSPLGLFLFADLTKPITDGIGEFLQYGALGLAAIMVLFLCIHVRYLTDQQCRERKEWGKRMDESRANLEELLKLAFRTRDKLSAVLKDRPCLRDDSRTSLSDTGED